MHHRLQFSYTDRLLFRDKNLCLLACEGSHKGRLGALYRRIKGKLKLA